MMLFYILLGVFAFFLVRCYVVLGVRGHAYSYSYDIQNALPGIAAMIFHPRYYRYWDLKGFARACKIVLPVV